MAWTLVASPLALAQAPVDPRPPNGAGQTPAFAGQTDAPEQKLGVAFDVVTVVQGLQNPWSVAFLPAGRMLITERPGRLRLVVDGALAPEPVAGVPPVGAGGQGGLLDVVLDPAFAQNRPSTGATPSRARAASTTRRSRRARSSMAPRRGWMASR